MYIYIFTHSFIFPVSLRKIIYILFFPFYSFHLSISLSFSVF